MEEVYRFSGKIISHVDLIYRNCDQFLCRKSVDVVKMAMYGRVSKLWPLIEQRGRIYVGNLK
ncbi:hypothetical protein DsansV1_C12g0115331 [Dioscorea sansibarensis]